MRTLFSLLIIFTLSATSAFSQFDLGIKLGYNSSLSLQSTKKDYKNYSFKKIRTEFSDSYHFGVFMRYSFNRLFIQPELLYLKQYNDYEFSFKDGAKTLAYFKYNMFEVPTLIGLKLLKSDRSSINIYAGPRFSTNINSSIKSKKNGEPEEDYKSFIKDLNVGLAFGLSIDLRSFLFDIRYNVDRGISKTYLKDLPTSNFLFSIGYKIF